jgi:hypothetical protein
MRDSEKNKLCLEKQLSKWPLRKTGQKNHPLIPTKKNTENGMDLME